AVVNADDPQALELARVGRARRFDFALDGSVADGVTVEGQAIVRRNRDGAAPLLPLTSVKLPGRHLLSDVLAATAVGCLAGVPPPLIHEALDDVVRVVDAGSMREAVQRASSLAKPGGVVLLAPACSSFDMFRDYAERGRAFKEAVDELANERSE